MLSCLRWVGKSSSTISDSLTRGRKFCSARVTPTMPSFSTECSNPAFGSCKSHTACRLSRRRSAKYSTSSRATTPTPAPRSAEVFCQFRERFQHQRLAVRRYLFNLVLPRRVVRNEHGAESRDLGGVDVGARRIADHPGVVGGGPILCNCGAGGFAA